jgi:hypothetical protein
MFVGCECWVSSDSGLCVGLITRPEESYRVWCVAEWDYESPIIGRLCPTSCWRGGGGLLRRDEKKWFSNLISFNVVTSEWRFLHEEGNFKLTNYFLAEY